MKTILNKIALGGGCHWCTEAVFQSLNGVEKVEQGYVASSGKNSTFSEAVIVHFNPDLIYLSTLIEIHINTHKSTSKHSMRDKYRSAIYYFTKEQKELATEILESLQEKFNNNLITQILPFVAFKASRQEITDYFYKNPHKPFCERYIKPKIETLQNKFPKSLHESFINSIEVEKFNTANYEKRKTQNKE